jgi:hypothetical protein
VDRLQCLTPGDVSQSFFTLPTESRPHIFALKTPLTEIWAQCESNVRAACCAFATRRESSLREV